MGIVDGHLHVFKRASDEYPREVHELFPADLEAPVEKYLEAMEGAGVSHAVLVPLSSDDRYVAECLTRFPGRFAAVGVHDPAAADPVQDLRRRRQESGLQGLRVHHLGAADVTDPEELELFPLLAALEAEGMVLWFYPSSEQLALLPGVLERLPGLDVMLNHLGFCQQGYLVDEYGRPRIPTALPPSTLPQVVQMARFPRVHVMFSGHYAFSQAPFPYEDLREVSSALYEAYGADRLMWASDYPWITSEPGYQAVLEVVDHHLPDLSSTERAAMLGGTARRLFRF